MNEEKIVKVRCPNCGQHYDMEDFEEGVEVNCEVCSKTFTLNRSLIIQEEKPKSVEENPQEPKSTEEKPQEPVVKKENREEPKSGSDRSKVLTNYLLSILILMMGVLVFMMFKINSTLETLSPKDNPIVGYKMIDYSWDYLASMKNDFDIALSSGYEPAGFVCQNGMRGGFFLFVKRKR